MNKLNIDKTHWKKCRFGDVAIQTKDVVDIENTNLTRYVAGEHMGSEDIHIRKWGTVGDGYLGPAFIRKFSKGDILYGSRRTYLKKVAIADFDGITANTTFVIKANEKLIEPVLLAHLMLSHNFTEYSVTNSRGSVNPYINWKDIADYEFLLPPKAEQKRLAELLWAADEVVEKEKREMEAIKVFKDRQMFYLLNGHQHTQNNEKPDGWERLTISDLGVVSTSSVDKKQRPKEKAVSLINYMDVYTSKTKKITSDIELMQVTAPDKQINSNQVNIGDILFTPSSETKDDIGHSAVVYEDLPNTLYSYHLVRLRFNREIDLDFKRYLFNNPSTLAYFTKRAQGITRMTLSLDDFNETPVLLPPLLEQRQIALKLSSIDSTIERIEKSISLSQQIKQELINKIFKYG